MWKEAKTLSQKMAVINGFLPLTANEYLKALIFFCGDDDERVWKIAVEKLKGERVNEIKKLISSDIPEKSVLTLTKFAGEIRDSSIVVLLLATGKLKRRWLLTYLAGNDQDFWTTLITHKDFIKFSLPQKDDFMVLFESIGEVLADLYREQLSYIEDKEIEEATKAKSEENQGDLVEGNLNEGNDEVVELESTLSDMPDFLVSDTAFDGLNPNDMIEKRKTMISMIKKMNIAEKIKIAMVGNLEVRKMLIKDPRKQVAMAVLSNAAITEKEIITIASDAAAPLEVITHIANLKSFSRNYRIKLALINNPKTPIKISLNLLDSVRINDLKRIAKNHNIPAIIKMTAEKRTK